MPRYYFDSQMELMPPFSMMSALNAPTLTPGDLKLPVAWPISQEMCGPPTPDANFKLTCATIKTKPFCGRLW